jgi:hypothetical protein
LDSYARGEIGRREPTLRGGDRVDHWRRDGTAAIARPELHA